MKKASLMFAIFALSLLADLSFSGEPRSQAQGHFISSLNATVTGLRFYESGHGKVPYKQRAYRTEFPKSSTRYVYGELRLEYPKGSPRTDFEVLAIYYNPDGSIFGQHSQKFYIDPEFTSVACASGRGWSESGNWEIGTYRVNLLIKGQKIASGSFSITAGKAESIKPRKRPGEKKSDIPDDLGEL